MKKYLALILALVLLTSVLSACSGDTPSTPDNPPASNGTENDPAVADDTPSAESPSEGGEILFWHIATESPVLEIYEFAIDMFNSNTDSGFTVTSVGTRNDVYKEKLIIAMSAGECPDVYSSWSGGPMIEYIEAGYAQPIDDLIGGFKDRIMEAGWAQGSHQGKVYGIPIESVCVAGVYYNSEMFDRFGLSVPKTLSELETICATLKDNGIVPFALANASKWTGSMTYMNLVTRHGGLQPFLDAATGVGSFESESFVFAGEKIQEWVNSGYFPEGVNSLDEDDGQARQLLYQEVAAMICIGSWYNGTFLDESEEFYEKVGWFSFPAVDGSNVDPSIQIGTVGDQFLHFNVTGDKLAAAVEMASCFSDPVTVDLIVESGEIPPVRNVKELITDPLNVMILDAALSASGTQLWYDQFLPPAVAQVHLDTLQDIFGLTMSPQDANAALQKAMQEALNS